MIKIELGDDIPSSFQIGGKESQAIVNGQQVSQIPNQTMGSHGGWVGSEGMGSGRSR